MTKLRIIFMGTPEFAVASLNVLVENGYDVAAVITAPDKPGGRGQQLQKSDVKVAAEKHGLKILQPTNLKAPEFIEELRGLNANLQIVVAFRMLPEAVWSMPSIGTFNLHASLLPQYRGAAPINWAIINGEKETGVTTFFLKHEIDTGNILFQAKETIMPDDDAGTLYHRLMNKGAELVLKTVKAIESGEYKMNPQMNSNDLRHAPKIFRETCVIDWNKKTRDIVNFVRGLSPYPGAWTTINGKTYKIFKVSINNTGIPMKTADGFVFIDELQPEGKKRMKASDFLRGYKL
ncbi:MAG TPA: methionyl-tRNA formyltransferase [Cyclobacteriaceae bacterium]